MKLPSCISGTRALLLCGAVCAALAAAVPAGAQTIVVLPFENQARAPALDWMSHGLAELSVERLAGEGRIVFPREEALAAVEKMGLPPAARLTRATMLRLAAEMDAEYLVFGEFRAAGGRITLAARVLRPDPPSLSPEFAAEGPVESLLDLHARVCWRILTHLDPLFPLAREAYESQVRGRRLDAFEQYIRGLLAATTDARMRAFREAARLDPVWTEPAFALGQDFYARDDCSTALIWLSRVPPAHPRGGVAGFLSGVCHLRRNDTPRAEAALAAVAEGVASPEVWNNLGVARARRAPGSVETLRDAAALFRRAAEGDPGDADYRFNLEATSRQLAAQSGRGEPPADFPAALRVKTRIEAPGRAWLAGLTAASPPGAERASGGTSGSNGGSVAARLALGREALAEGNLAAAEQHFSAAVLDALGEAGAASGGADYAAGQLGLAEVHRRRGQLEQAVRAARLALWSQEDAGSRLLLARLYLEMNRTAEARSELRAVLRAEATPEQREEARRLLDALGATPPQALPEASSPLPRDKGELP